MQAATLGNFSPISVWCVTLMGLQSLKKGAPPPPSRSIHVVRVIIVVSIYMSSKHLSPCPILSEYPVYMHCNNFIMPPSRCVVCLHLHNHILTGMYTYSRACHVSLAALRCSHSFPSRSISSMLFPLLKWHYLCHVSPLSSLPLNNIRDVHPYFQSTCSYICIFVSQHVPQPHSHVR